MPQIAIENLHKSFKISRRKSGFVHAIKGFIKREYEVIRAISDISFCLNEGELVGYIGPNGAGKSTTVKIMSGILVPDSGTCEIIGRTPWKDRQAHVQNIGVVFGQRTQLWWDVPVIDSFDLLKDIYSISRSSYVKTRDELIDVLSLQSIIETPVRQLSLGQKMRCELAASLLHQPPVLFLDEPTIGLDAVSKIAVRDFIRRINRERGVTVILTTHDMDDIEGLCSRIMVIGKGSILFDGTIEKLRKMVTSERVVRIEFLDNPGRLDYPIATLMSHEDNRAEFRFDPEKTSAIALIKALSNDNRIKDFVIENLPIEEIVAGMYNGFRI